MAEGRVCKEAAKYSKNLCRAILKDMHQQMRLDGTFQFGCIGMMACEDEKPDGSHIRLPEDGFTGKYRNDLTSQILCHR